MIHDGSLLVRDGILEQVGLTRRIENLKEARDAIEVSAAGRVVLPGFVDSHTHLLFPPPGVIPLRQLAISNAMRTISAMRLEIRARVHLEAMARHGTTTVEVKTGSGADPRIELKMLRALSRLDPKPVDVIRTVLLRVPRELPAKFASDAALHEKSTTDLLAKIRRRRLAEFVDVAWEDEAVPGRIVRRSVEVASVLGFRLKVHADGVFSGDAVAFALEHRAVSVDHLEYVTRVEAEWLGKSATIATLLPSASFHRNVRYAPARMLIEGGAAVALATNFNPYQTPALSMQTVIMLACSRMGMTPEEAISAATINGAHALARAANTGSLEVGKSADLVIMNVSDYRDLAQQFGMNLVYMTMKGGQIIYEEGEVTPRPLERLPAW